MEYTEKDLVKIAKRENNTKRNLLLWQILSGRNTKMKNFCWWALRRQQLP